MRMLLNRRQFIALAGGVVGAPIWPSRRPLFSFPSGVETGIRFYVGTYTSAQGRGIYHCSFDPAAGRINVLGATGGITNPSFLAADPRGRYLFAVSETAEFEGKPVGSVHAFSVDGTSGGLTHLNAQPSHGADPAHLSIDKRGRFVLVANYTGGNVCVFPVGEDGHLGPVVANVQHVGRGPNPQRQEKPHAHSIVLDPASRRAFSADLGIDRVMVSTFNADTGALAPAEQPEVVVAPGAGPRHMDFSPDGKFLYVVNELNSTVTVLSYDLVTGSLTELQTISTLPSSWKEDNTGADIHAHPSGRYVYASNRGHDSIAVFAVGQSGGTLTAVQHQPTHGKSPRNFALDPSGRFLLAANQRSDSMLVMRIDQREGTLAPIGDPVAVPSPVCIRFMTGP
jgi:6-phosphogluconolactonase